MKKILRPGLSARRWQGAGGWQGTSACAPVPRSSVATSTGSSVGLWFTAPSGSGSFSLPGSGNTARTKVTAVSASRLSGVGGVAATRSTSGSCSSSAGSGVLLVLPAPASASSGPSDAVEMGCRGGITPAALAYLATPGFQKGFTEQKIQGASVSTDGVCLTVTEILSPTQANFDVMLQSLNITTLGTYQQGDRVNVERAAKDGAEIGGHPLSGHVDFTGTLVQRREFDNNLVWRVAVPPDFRKYVYAKGYIAIHGASLTVAEVNRAEGWFEVWLIPETRRATVFEDKRAGDVLNIEIERSTQVVVDTVREAVHESLGRLQPVLEALLKEKGLSLDDFVQAPVVPH